MMRVNRMMAVGLLGLLPSVLPAGVVRMPPACTKPDGMAVDPKGRLVIAAPNNDRKAPGAVFRIDAPDRAPVKWFDVPVHPETGYSQPMGLAFGPEGELYVCDCNEKGKGRLLRVTFRDDAFAGCETVAGGLDNANGVKYLKGKLYLTQAFLYGVTRADGAATSGLYMFDATDRDVRVKNVPDESHCVFSDITRNPAVRGGLNGVAVTARGEIFTGNYGDGRVWKLTPGADGRIAKSVEFVRPEAGIVTPDGLCVDAADNVYVADMRGDAAWRITPQGAVELVRRGGFDRPSEPCVWKGGLYVSDYGATTVQQINLRPLINAHRGSRHEYDDNAAGGFRKCLENGVRGFETDVRLTKDDELVIMHDKDVSRTTTGTGDIHGMTLAEVTALTLKRSGENVPTPKDIAEIFRGVRDVRIEWEMKESGKSVGSDRLALYCDKLYDIVSRTMEPGTYRFTSFSRDTLETMKRRHPEALTGYITGKPLTRAFVDEALAIGCGAVAPGLRGTTKDMIDYAHAKGMETTPWMNQCYRDYAKIVAIGGDTGTSDYAMELLKKVKAKRRLVCLDLDATLCQHRSPIPPENLAALKELMKHYKCIMVGAGNAPRIHRQMGNFPIDIIGNYGMQEAVGEDGNFRIVRAVTNTVDRKFFREKTDYLRQKYGYTQYEGEPLEFHASGMVTFGLLGTAPSAEHKVKFDPDRKKRKAMYKEVCEIFRDYSVFIGGSTSFDFAGKEYNKYDAIMAYAKRNGYALDEIVFIGDDFGDGGGDSHVRIRGMDYIEIEDYREFPQAVSILLRD